MLPLPIQTHETPGNPHRIVGHRRRCALPTSSTPFDLDAALARDVSPVRSPRLLARLWHWRSVLLLGAGTPAGLLALAESTHPAASVSLVLTAAVGLVGWPAARRWAMRRFWGVLIPHRLRTAFAEAWICNRRGRPPRILWTSSGEGCVMVWLWCPPGLGIDQLLTAHEILTTTCWASDVHVERHELCGQLVVLGVSRVRTDHWWDR